MVDNPAVTSATVVFLVFLEDVGFWGVGIFAAPGYYSKDLASCCLIIGCLVIPARRICCLCYPKLLPKKWNPLHLPLYCPVFMVAFEKDKTLRSSKNTYKAAVLVQLGTNPSCPFNVLGKMAVLKLSADKPSKDL